MKITKFLVALMATGALFASCSNESDNNETVNGENAILNISIAPASRAIGDVTTGGYDSDNTINNYIAFVYKASGVLEASAISATAADLSMTGVTTAAKEVYVVANAPATLFSSVRDNGVSTKNDLMAVVGELNNSGASALTKGNIWASGNQNITFSLNASNKYESTTTVGLTFVGARINLTSIEVTKVGSRSFVIDEVLVLNATNKSKLFGTAGDMTPASPEYLSGMDLTGFNYIPATWTVVPFFKDAYSAGSKYFYYVMENKNPATPTILTLKSTIGGTDTRYFALHFSPSDEAGEFLTRGKSYDVTLKLDIDTDKDPGTIDPTDPSVNAELKVVVTPAAWTAKTITKEF